MGGCLGKAPQQSALDGGLHHANGHGPDAPIGKSQAAAAVLPGRQADIEAVPSEVVPRVSSIKLDLHQQRQEQHQAEELPGIPAQLQVPLPISQAPAGLLPTAAPEMPYAPPFLPPPSLPPPDYPEAEQSPPWQPGRKRALLVACNYQQTEAAALQGCVNDINCLRLLLASKFGFLQNNIVMLHDMQPHPLYTPTKANILAAARWLVADSQNLDSLVFAFSGRGAQPQHLSGGSWDEAILPSDYQQAGALTDDDLHAALIRPLQQGVRLLALIDALSATPSLNLEYSASLRRDGWAEWQLGAHQRQRQVQLPDDVLLAAAQQLDDDQLMRSAAVLLERPQGEAVLLTSIADDEFVDAQQQGLLPSTGAICFCVIQAAEQGQAGTYNVLLRALKHGLKNSAAQFQTTRPHLYASKRLDFNRPLIL